MRKHSPTYFLRSRAQLRPIEAITKKKHYTQGKVRNWTDEKALGLGLVSC